MTRPGPDTSKPPDRLAGEAELSRVYRDGAEPSAELDESILAASRRAVGAGPQRHGKSVRRWTPALGVAAVLVLAVTLVSLMPREQLAPRPEAAAPARLKGAEPAPMETERRERSAPSEAVQVPETRRPRGGEEALPATAPIQALDAEPNEALAPAPDLSAPRQDAESGSLEYRLGPSLSSGAIDPEVWRRRIAALVELGDYSRAARELAAFRERYPDYPRGELERRLEGLDE